MKLLFVTQAVDTENPALGFVCNWLREFSTRFSSIEVICLTEGTHTLPDNVHVHSLGKEKGNGSKVWYAVRFTYLAWKLRKKYDAVFVHMNPEYILLASDQWRLFRKKVYLWYNHTVGSTALRFAAPFTRKIFHTSPFAYTARYTNAVLMPAGVDTKLFAPQSVLRYRSAIYFQGRVAPAKKVHVLLEALRIVRKGIPQATVTVVGPEDDEYGKKLKEDFSDLIGAHAATFLGPKPNTTTPPLFAAHGVTVNLTTAGNFDKTVLESAACETPVIVASDAFSGVVPSEWVVAGDDAGALAKVLIKIMTLPEEEYRSLRKAERDAVIKKHSLTHLADRLVEELTV